jgi:hypothetical protein
LNYQYPNGPQNQEGENGNFRIKSNITFEISIVIKIKNTMMKGVIKRLDKRDYKIEPKIF